MRLLPKNQNAWSHHPNCSLFSNHVYRIKGYLICRGCTNFYLGLSLGFVFYIILSFFKIYDVFLILLIICLTFIPTPINVIFEFNRIIKDIARLLLGFSTASSIYSIFSSIIYLIKEGITWYRIVIPLGVIIAFFIFKEIFVKKRHTYNAEKCFNCPLDKCELLSKKNIKKRN